MNETEKKEVASLRNKIHQNDYLYYVKDSPEISDRDYDSLYHRLKELEGENRKLKQMYADLSLEHTVLKDIVEKKLQA